jgi:hypothetical protein
MKNQKFSLDLQTIIKALPIPGIIALVLAIANWIDFDLGVFFTLLITFMEAFAGANFIRTLIASGKSYQLVNAGINAGILAGLTMWIFRIFNYFFLSIRYSDWSLSVGWTIAYVLEAAFIGFLAALAWTAYQREKNPTE